MQNRQMKAKKTRSKYVCGKKLNNGGMSLVEVIIAMTIFTIVAIPVLHSLTTAAVYNQKARKRQNVTALAESVMENFKGYPIDTLEKEIFTGVEGAKNLGLEIVNDSDISFEYAEPGKNESEITFKINNIQRDNGKYNIEIKAKPSVKSETLFEIDNASEERDASFKYDYAKKYYGGIYDEVENNFLSKAATIDGMLMGGDDKDTGLFVFYYDEDGNQYTINSKTFELDRLKILKREYIYKIKKDGEDYVVTVFGAYIYQLQKHPWYEKAAGAAPPPSSTEASTDTSTEGSLEQETSTETVPQVGDYVVVPEDRWLQSFVHYMDLLDTSGSHDGYDIIPNMPMHDIPLYDSTGGTHDARDDEIIKGMTEKEIYRGKDLKRLLIYFYPAYKGSSGFDDNFKDVIKIEDETNGEFDCYLIKQKNPDMSKTQLTINEGAYKLDVYGTGTSNMRIFHNLDENIGKDTGTVSSSGIKESEFKKVDNYITTDVFKTKKVMAYELSLILYQTADDGSNGPKLTELKGTMYEKYREYGDAD